MWFFLWQQRHIFRWIFFFVSPGLEFIDHLWCVHCSKCVEDGRDYITIIKPCFGQQCYLIIFIMKFISKWDKAGTELKVHQKKERKTRTIIRPCTRLDVHMGSCGNIRLEMVWSWLSKPMHTQKLIYDRTKNNKHNRDRKRKKKQSKCVTFEHKWTWKRAQRCPKNHRELFVGLILKYSRFACVLCVDYCFTLFTMNTLCVFWSFIMDRPYPEYLFNFHFSFGTNYLLGAHAPNIDRKWNAKKFASSEKIKPFEMAVTHNEDEKKRKHTNLDANIK